MKRKALLHYKVSCRETQLMVLLGHVLRVVYSHHNHMFHDKVFQEVVDIKDLQFAFAV